MKKSIFTRRELIEKADISELMLVEWEQCKLIKPIGYTDDQVPFYNDDSIEQACQLRKLCQLGYEIGAIQTIIKKVGLPNHNPGRGETAKMDQFLTVGGLAEAVGVSPRTLKHWEDKGIIEPDMRSEGGFRLYSKAYIYLCNLIQDLQLFGYSLEQIKQISDYFRDFLKLRDNQEPYTPAEVQSKVDEMLNAIQLLNEKMNLLKNGIQRWEDLLKKKHKELLAIRNQNQKRIKTVKGD